MHPTMPSNITHLAENKRLMKNRPFVNKNDDPGGRHRRG